MTNLEERSSMFDPPGETPPPKKGMNRGLVFAIIGVVVVLLCLIVGGVALALGNFFGEVVTQRQSSIPELLSAETQAYGTITPALSDIPNIARIQAAYPELFIEEDPEAVNEQLAELGLTFEDDIQPWIGAEAAFAVQGIDDFQAFSEALESEDEVEILNAADFSIIVASRDNAAAQTFLQKLRAGIEDRGEGVVETTYNDVTIYEEASPPEGRDPAAFALVNSNFVLASNIAVLQEMIDRDPAGEDTLVNSQRFQDLRASLPSNAIGYIYLNGQMFADMAAQASDEAMAELSPEEAEALQQQIQNVEAIESIGLSISVEGEGVAFDGVTNMDISALDEASQQYINSLGEGFDTSRFENVSSESLALISLKIPENFKEQVLTALEAQPDGEETIAQFEMQTGLDLEEDFLNWFNGDVLIVMLPGSGAVPVGGYFSIAPQDLDAAQASMEKIADLITQAGGITFETQSIANQEWQTITDPSTGQTMGGYGFVDESLVIAFSEGSMEAAVTGGDTPITQHPAFATVTDNLPSPNGGVFFFDVREVVTLADSFGMGAQTPEEEEFRRFIEPIEAIGIAGEPGPSESGTVRGRVFVSIEAPEGE